MLRAPGYLSYQYVSGAQTATGSSATFSLQNNDWDGVTVGLVVTAASGTSPTLDLYVQTQGGDGNMYDMYHWPQQTGTTTTNNQIWVGLSTGVGLSRLIGIVGSKTVAANTLGVPILSNVWQLAWTIGGTSPSFNFTVNFYQNNTERPI